MRAKNSSNTYHLNLDQLKRLVEGEVERILRELEKDSSIAALDSACKRTKSLQYYVRQFCRHQSDVNIDTYLATAIVDLEQWHTNFLGCMQELQKLSITHEGTFLKNLSSRLDEDPQSLDGARQDIDQISRGSLLQESMTI